MKIRVTLIITIEITLQILNAFEIKYSSSLIVTYDNDLKRKCIVFD